jgi:nucleoside-diphosphate-sugar epimerase
MAREQVLVTGGSGFVGSHCVAALLNAGYRSARACDLARGRPMYETW